MIVGGQWHRFARTCFCTGLNYSHQVLVAVMFPDVECNC